MSRARSFADIVVGEEIPVLERVPTKAQLVMYAGAEDDYMPVHFDHHYAVAAGQPGVINHGWLTYAILLQAVTTWMPPEAASIVRTHVRYMKPTFPDHPIVCHGRVIGKTEENGRRILEVEAFATDGDGEVTTRAGVTLDVFESIARAR
jgi:acyl dehydratase